MPKTEGPPRRKTKTQNPDKPKSTMPKDKDGNVIFDRSKISGSFHYVCACCGKEYLSPEKNFMKSDSPLFAAWGGFAPFCRTCADGYFTKVVLPVLDQDVDKAIEFCCGVFDWYYDKRIVEAARAWSETFRKKGNDPQTLLQYYSARRKIRAFKPLGSTYLDRIRKRAHSEKYAYSEDEEELERVAGIADIKEDDVLLFGPGYSAEEYVYLRGQYDEWRERYSCETKAQEEIFKNIAIAQVNVRRAQQDGDQKKTNDAMKSLQDLMDSAKVKPKQKTDSALVEQNTFGTLIQKWENEEPIPEAAPEWQDVDGIKKYITTWFYGHLCKMFKLDNDASREYEEEIAKYTVEPPHYLGDEDEEGDSAVGQQLKAMRGKTSEGGELT